MEGERAVEEREYGPKLPPSAGASAENNKQADKKGGGASGRAGGAGGTEPQAPALPDLHQIVGYMPKRGDFDQEYDGDADTLLADLEYFDDDTDHDIKLKNDVIELYNARIDERIRRKKFVLERGLLDFKKTQK